MEGVTRVVLGGRWVGSDENSIRVTAKLLILQPDPL